MKSHEGSFWSLWLVDSVHVTSVYYGNRGEKIWVRKLNDLWQSKTLRLKTWAMSYDYWAKYYVLQVQVDYKVFYPPLS